MRWNLLAAFGLIALSFVAVVIVACSSSASCKPNSLQLEVALLGTSSYLADRVTVTDVDPDPALMMTQSFPHTAGDVTKYTVDVTWPNGYPADKVVHLIVKAFGGVAVLAVNAAIIHLDPSCTSAEIILTGNSIPDAATFD